MWKKSCWHVRKIEHSFVRCGDGKPAELEFLFAPFAPFRILSVDFKVNPHAIELEAIPDGDAVRDAKELFPWH